MADVHDAATRSYNMSRVKGKDTKPEWLVRRYLFGKGFRYRLHDKKLPGKPDLVFRKHKTVVFIHGCFWHGHEGCKYSRLPGTNADWWMRKIQATKEHDKKVVSQLTDLGWKVLFVWECELKSGTRLNTLQEVAAKISM
jgi:DNA mismatch endonuclease, patch repair protein